MIITDNDILYTELYYLNKEILDLDSISRGLLQNNFCELVFHSNGYVFFNDGKKVLKTDINFGNIKYNAQDIEFTPKDNIFPSILEGQLRELAYIGAKIRSMEYYLFHPDYIESFSYIRIFLKPISVIYNGLNIIINSEIKLYNNGVLLISFRPNWNNRECDIDTFVKRIYNFSRYEFDMTGLPINIGLLMGKSQRGINEVLSKQPQTLMNKFPLYRRYKAWNKIIEHERKYVNLKDHDKMLFQLKDGNLGKLSNTILSAFIHVINSDNEGWKFILFGFNNNGYTVNGYGLTRFKIHILDFIDQPDTSESIIEKWSDELGKIMYGQSLETYENQKQFLGKNLRDLNDFCLF